MKKKICLLIYNIGSGGAEHVLSQWSYLLSEKFDVYMTVFDGDTQPNYSYYGKLYNLDVKSDNSKVVKKIHIVLKRARRLKKFVKENDIDLVLSFCNECNLVNTISKHSAKKVCSIRSVSDLHANIFVNYVIKSPQNKIILQTQALKNHLVQEFGNRIKRKTIVFGNPFDINVITEKAQDEPPAELTEILSKQVTIVNVASFKPSKNHENLLKSFELLCDSFPGVYLILIGADSSGKRQEIMEMARMSKYAEKIIFAGEMKNPFPVVSRSSLFVLPSLAEGIPNALAEAMICGVPVIASNCPTGPQELLSDSSEKVEYNDRGYFFAKYGVLVRPFRGGAKRDNDYVQENQYFANAMQDVLESTSMYEEARKRSKTGAQRFDINVYKDELNKLVESLLIG